MKPISQSKVLILIATLAFAAFLPGSDLAHGDEHHKERAHHHDLGPHQGKVEELANGLHLEAVRAQGMVTFYVLDHDGGKESSLKLSEGSATILNPGKPQEQATLPQELNKATVKVAEKGKVILILNMKAQDKGLSAKFSFEN